MTREEVRAVSFVGVLLLLASAARFAARPRPITITAGPIDIGALRAAGKALQQGPPARPGRRGHGRPPTTTTVEPHVDPPPHRRSEPLYILEDQAPAVTAGPLNLNRATADELDRLPGVGPAMAKRIVARRDSVGGFRRLEDLDSVKGIGPALLKKLKPLVVVR